jgi:zinc protease
MVKFEHFQLSNGLTVLVNEDNTTPMVALDLLYNVGSRDEKSDKTGFAHLFEHLMFGGSANIPSFDEPTQMIGGENNAGTSNDITSYYMILPSDNIETALWLESDRMLQLNFSEDILRVQQNVVIEEFNQRYLNQPYGDTWLILRPLAYKVHPYKCPTIGERIEHIRDASLEDVKSFFYSHYAPNNAFLALSGNINADKAYSLVQKWFGNIEKRAIKPRNIPQEPVQNDIRKLDVTRKVPSNAIFKVWHMPARLEKEYYVCDLISDLLSGGKSARLYQKLVKEKKLFSEINAYITGDIDPGLFVVSGKIMENVSIEKADQEIENLLQNLLKEKVTERELKKVQNRYETNILMAHTNILNKAMDLTYFQMLGNADLLNQEVEKYCSITPDDITTVANAVIRENNCSTLYYMAEK